MEYTKEFTSYIRENIEIPNVNVIEIYDVKTIDIKRGNYLFIYTADRQIRQIINKNAMIENVGLVFDFRGYDYWVYVSMKENLKFCLWNVIRGGKYDWIDVQMSIGTELSNKARGLYRFTINIFADVLKEYDYYALVYDDNYEVIDGSVSFENTFSDDYEINVPSNYEEVYDDDYEG